MMKQPLISIIVLNYNGKQFLKECFDSLLAATYQQVELLMVDNASTDDSVEYIQRNYPQVKVVNSGGNIGYSAGNNAGIAEAAGKYVLLLNNDIEVTPGWLEPIIEEFESDPRIAAVQPKIRHMLERDSFEYAGAAGGMIDIFGFPFMRGRVFYTTEKDLGQYDTNIDLFWTSGAAMAIRKDVLEKSGLLDNDFVHHMEEIDLCWRILLQGYRLRIRTDSVIYHYAGGTIKAWSFKKEYWNHRNSIFMMMKNYSSSRLAVMLTVRLLLDILVVVKSVLVFDTLKISAIVQAHGWLFDNLPMILRKRRAVQRNRVVSDQALDKFMYHRSVAIDYFLGKKLTFDRLWK
ncbi:MAG: glycosyltransferase family 2 protein [Candidatus Marinimicrobia bacterium]|nr:glycosyltransferase family 2 protein [Candidatus Neomarinimicrobiota bacterium]